MSSSCRAAQRSRGERPQLGQAAQQRRLAAARRPVITNDSPGSSRTSSGSMSVSPAGVRTSTSSSSIDAVGARHRGQSRQRAGLFVGVDQPVEADDRRPVAGERVVDVAEERQRVLNAGRTRDADWVTSPKLIWPANNRGAWIDQRQRIDDLRSSTGSSRGRRCRGGRTPVVGDDRPRTGRSARRVRRLSPR